MIIKKSTLVFSIYFTFCFFLYHFFVYPVMIGRILPGANIQLYFDSLTYHTFVKEGLHDVYGLFSLTSNYVGPFIIIRLLKHPFFIFLFNCCLLIISFKIIKRNYTITNSSFLLFFVLNPIILVSVLSVNKESISVLVTALLLVYAKGKKLKGYGFFVLVLAFFVRWQLALFVLMYQLVTIKLNFHKKKPLLSLAFIVLVLSCLVPLINTQTNVFSAIAANINKSEYSGGFFAFFLNLESIPGGYLLSVIPKTLHLLFGVLIKNYHRLFDFSDFINNVIVFLHSLFLAIVFIRVLLKRKFTFKNPLIFLLCLYCVVFGLSPIYAPRYFLPVYIILLVVLYEKECYSKSNYHAPKQYYYPSTVKPF